MRLQKQKYHGFLRKYQNVYIFIAILVAGGFLMGIFLSQYIDASDISSLSGYLTTIEQGEDTYAAFVNEFFTGILFILFVFLLGTSLIGIPLISFIVFTKGLQIGFSCALFVCSYQLKGILGIILTLLPQVIFDLVATFLISASAIQLSMYLIYSSSNKERLDFKKLANSVLNDICICFVIVLLAAYAKSTLIVELIKLFNNFS